MTLTLGAVLRDAAARLSASDIPSAALDGRLLICRALGINETTIVGHPERTVSIDECARIDAAVNRRCAREPLAHIVGEKEFWSLNFHVSASVLTPRPDTETLIEAVLSARPDSQEALRILDLGTGSGCILLTLLSEYPNACGVGIDISPDAIEVAGTNARTLGLQGRSAFVCANWCDPLNARFDVIVSNPPYIPENDIQNLEPEVAAFEPLGALTGGKDGLDAYRTLADLMPRFLKNQGLAAFEIGMGQSNAVVTLLKDAGLSALNVRRDLAGVERVICAELK